MPSPNARASERDLRWAAAREEIAREGYLTFVDIWLGIDPKARALDLCAGAGGWLRLLRDCGIAAQGAEPDAARRQSALTAGFPVASDPDQALETVEPESLAILTDFTALDRLDPQQLSERLPSMLRALRPGGILVLAGANAEHPAARTVRTAPTEAANQLAGRRLARIAVIRTGGVPLDAPVFGLREALYGLAPEVAVVAQTQAQGLEFDRFHEAFADWGDPPPETMARHFDSCLNSRIEHLEAAVEALRQDRIELDRSITELRTLTRRRGLRKVLHARRVARKAPPPELGGAISASEAVQPAAAEPLRQGLSLTDRMRALRERITR